MKKIADFETQTEEELREIMGGAVAANTVATAALAYGIYLPTKIAIEIAKKLLG